MKKLNLIYFTVILLILFFNCFQLVVSNELKSPKDNNGLVDDKINSTKTNKTKVFIVHGRNTYVRQKVYNLLEKLNFEPIVLYERANNGDTIIEKLEREVDKCKFGIVIMSPDNIVYTRGANNVTYSEFAYPRLNVIFEFGLLIGKYGRENVIYLNVPYTGNASSYDLPSDLLGYVWVNFDEQLSELENEIKIGNYTKNKR